MKLELQGITKRFGTFTANDAIDLTIAPGEIHCLLGENGAGKSTLMNVLYGLLQPDGGHILIDGQQTQFKGPGDAVAAGIGMVHQHFMLIPVFTVAENLMLGNEDTKSGVFLDRQAAADRVRSIGKRLGFTVDPDTLVEDLPVGSQQRVEIIKALSRDAEVLILDEPTAVLTPSETDEFMQIMKDLTNQGTSIVFITHKLREVRAVADRITVIRRGKVIDTVDATTSEAELAALMVGRDVQLTVDRQPANAGSHVLDIAHLTVRNNEGRVLVRDANLSVAAGEIVGIAGVQGNGQTALTEAVAGLSDGPVTGSIVLEGKQIRGLTAKEIIDAGVGHVPEDRAHDGLISNFTIAENLVLNRSDREPVGGAIRYSPTAARERASALISEFDIRAEGTDSIASSLSGGNQQKVVMARELSRDLKVLIASQPTRGVDVGSIEFLHERLIAERDKGTAVLIVSTELDEILALSDRIAVMYRGKIIGIVPGGTSRDVIGLMMAGITPEIDEPATDEIEGTK